MNKDQFSKVLMVFSATIVLLLILSLVPNTSIPYKHFSLLSDVCQKQPEIPQEVEEEEEEPALPDAQKIDTAIVQKNDSLPAQADKPQHTRLEKEQGKEIADFSADGTMLAPLFKALQACKQGGKAVRIGVLGDSFIEADILTAKLRNLLQSKYGGVGVGFVPITSPAAQYRRTVHHSFENWVTYSMLYYKKADWKRFCLSGHYFIPSEGASFGLKTVTRENVTQASFFFINQKNTKLQVSINGEPAKLYEPQGSEELQCLTFGNNSIRSLDVKLTQVEGFTAFGTYLNNPSGVYVDNYAVRGSSGNVLVTVNKELTSQLKKYVPYDLLIVEYGLNVIANENYRGYVRLMKAAVNHLRNCYPNVPILLMSIGDKGVKGADGVSTHPGVLSLIDAQRKIAKDTGICFWNTYQAMGGDKSMISFVNHKPPLAAKDYTHINPAGGDFIGERLFEALMIEEKRLVP